MLWEFCFWQTFRFFWKHALHFLLPLTPKRFEFSLTWWLCLTTHLPTFQTVVWKWNPSFRTRGAQGKGLIKKMSLCFISIYVYPVLARCRPSAENFMYIYFLISCCPKLSQIGVFRLYIFKLRKPRHREVNDLPNITQPVSAYMFLLILKPEPFPPFITGK